MYHDPALARSVKADPRPKSAVSTGCGLAGLVGMSIWLTIARTYGLDGPFAALGNLNWGDRVIIHAYGSMYIYEVRQNQTISPYNMTVMEHEEDAWLTLITCKNYNEATDTYANRIAVRAVLVKVQSDTSANQSGNIR